MVYSVHTNKTNCTLGSNILRSGPESLLWKSSLMYLVFNTNLKKKYSKNSICALVTFVIHRRMLLGWYYRYYVYVIYIICTALSHNGYQHVCCLKCLHKVLKCFVNIYNNFKTGENYGDNQSSFYEGKIPNTQQFFQLLKMWFSACVSIFFGLPSL